MPIESYISEFSDVQGTDLYCDREAEGTIRAALDKIPLNAVHYIGNGNYHYISLFFLEKIQEDFDLILFDHHSDCQEGAFGPALLSCGNWVLAAEQRLPHLRSVRWTGGPATSSLPEDTAGIPEDTSDVPVYVSIDLDILSKEYIETVWDQGSMNPDTLERLLEGIFRSRKVLGVDVCGYTDINHPLIKRLDSFLSGFLLFP